MVIGLHGCIGAGKNAAAARLALLTPDRVVEVSFARLLKQSAAALLGCTVDDLEQWKNEPYRLVSVGVDVDGLGLVPTSGQTVRQFLQRYGTEAHRDVFGRDFWLDAALPADRFYDDGVYVVTDTRFPNEAQRVRDVGGIIVGLRGPDTSDSAHVSEVPLDCDVWLDNSVRDDGYAALDSQLRWLLSTLNRDALAATSTVVQRAA